MKTYTAKPDEIDRKWLVLDAAGQPMGRLAVDIARILRGKDKPCFSPHLDTGDFVVVVNAAKIQLSGHKGSEKIYRHSGWPGAIRFVTRAHEMQNKPEEALRRVVKGMLPHNRLGRQLINKLKVYEGPEHPHEAQQPTAWVNPMKKYGAKEVS